MKGRARTNAEFERIYGSRERALWIKTLPCVACGKAPYDPAFIHNAHVKSGGIGHKASAEFVVPLCIHCHDLAHRKGHKTLEAKFGVDLLEKAEYIQALWEAHEARNSRP